MSLAGMHAKDLAGGGDLKTFRGPAVRLQLLFRFRGISWHCVNPFYVGRVTRRLPCKIIWCRFNPNSARHPLKLGANGRRPLPEPIYCTCCAVCATGLATGTPFFGASSATKTLPSIRGI